MAKLQHKYAHGRWPPPGATAQQPRVRFSLVLEASVNTSPRYRSLYGMSRRRGVRARRSADRDRQRPLLFAPSARSRRDERALSGGSGDYHGPQKPALTSPNVLEAAPGIEPGYRALQALA
jgi:hypothetical protein